MPKRFNISAQHLQPQGGESLSVAPGEGFDFTAEEATTLGVEWDTHDPHAGLDDEKTFKTKRDEPKSEASPAPENTEPGDPKETTK